MAIELALMAIDTKKAIKNSPKHLLGIQDLKVSEKKKVRKELKDLKKESKKLDKETRRENRADRKKNK